MHSEKALTRAAWPEVDGYFHARSLRCAGFAVINRVSSPSRGLALETGWLCKADWLAGKSFNDSGNGEELDDRHFIVARGLGGVWTYLTVLFALFFFFFF